MDYLGADASRAASVPESRSDFRDHVIVQPQDSQWIALWAGPIAVRDEFIGSRAQAIAWALDRSERVLVWDVDANKHIEYRDRLET